MIQLVENQHFSLFFQRTFINDFPIQNEIVQTLQLSQAYKTTRSSASLALQIFWVVPLPVIVDDSLDVVVA